MLCGIVLNDSIQRIEFGGIVTYTAKKQFLSQVVSKRLHLGLKDPFQVLQCKFSGRFARCIESQWQSSRLEHVVLLRQDLKKPLPYVHEYICGKLGTIRLVDRVAIPPVCPDDLVSVIVDLLTHGLLHFFPFAVQSFSGFSELRFLPTTFFGFG